jgi:carboxymethylenebutenolidase
MIEQNLEIRAADGTTEAHLVRPDSSDPLPAVIQLTDIFGLRPAFIDQAKRIAERGYVVLTPNIFYRTSKLPVFTFEPDFTDQRTRDRVGELREPLKIGAMERDGSAYVSFLASQPFVSKGPMGVVGFCFSGKFALLTAACCPERIAAVASFHGAGLFTDTIDSPHLVLPRVHASLYFGHATNDNTMPTEAIEKFEWALQSWGGDYQSEVYEAKHGWMIPGRDVYDPENASRGFDKLMHLLEDSLRAPRNTSKSKGTRRSTGSDVSSRETTQNF